MSDDVPVFAIEFTSEGLSAAFVHADGCHEGLAGFDLTDFHAGGDTALDKLITLLAAKARTGGEFSSVAVSLACDLDASRVAVMNYPEARWLNGVPLASLLRDALAAPVVMERRAAVLLHYDCAMLGLPPDSLVVGCYIDQHYDSAIWHSGRILAGRHGMAGNIAHMTIHDREDACFCGKAGCVDLYGAGTRFQQLHSMIFADTPIDDMFLLHGDHPIIQDYLRMMAYPIAMEANVIDPDFLVLGGSVLARPGFPQKTLQDAIVDNSYRPVPGMGPVIMPSVAMAVPGVVPTALYVRQSLDSV